MKFFGQDRYIIEQRYVLQKDKYVPKKPTGNVVTIPAKDVVIVEKEDSNSKSKSKKTAARKIINTKQKKRKKMEKRINKL